MHIFVLYSLALSGALFCFPEIGELPNPAGGEMTGNNWATSICVRSFLVLVVLSVMALESDQLQDGLFRTAEVFAQDFTAA